VFVCVCVCVCVGVPVCVYVCVCMHKHTYTTHTHTHVHTHTHTHTNTHTHTHTHTHRLPGGINNKVVAVLEQAAARKGMKVIEGKGDEGDTLRARTIYVYDTAQVSFASILGLFCLYNRSLLLLSISLNTFRARTIYVYNSRTV
jgi:hypothetical protein